MGVGAGGCTDVVSTHGRACTACGSPAHRKPLPMPLLLPLLRASSPFATSATVRATATVYAPCTCHSLCPAPLVALSLPLDLRHRIVPLPPPKHLPRYVHLPLPHALSLPLPLPPPLPLPSQFALPLYTSDLVCAARVTDNCPVGSELNGTTSSALARDPSANDTSSAT